MRPRLLMIVHGPYPVGEPRVQQEAQAALEAGFRVKVVATRRPGESKREGVEGVVVIRLSVPGLRRTGGLAAAVREYGGFAASATAVAARAVRRGDIVQVHNPPSALFVSALLPSLRGARTILDIHDLDADMFEMRFGRHPLVTKTLIRAECIAAALADAVVTVHEPYRRELIRHGVEASKIHVVMNVVDERLLPPKPNVSDGHFRVVYHGTVTPHYGVPLLVEATALAATKVRDIRLDVVGEGDDLEAVACLATKLNIRERVHLSGSYVSRAEALRSAALASVGVIPNLPVPLNAFALPSKLFELVALEIPVVSADLPTIRGHFSERELLYFRAGDAQDLARALVAVADDPAAARERARRALERYKAYNWDKSASDYVRLLERLVRPRA